MNDETDDRPVVRGEDAVDQVDHVDNNGRHRTVWVHALIAIAAVVLLVTSTNVWVKRQMLDTDQWVSTAEQLLADEEIRMSVSAFLVDELYNSVDIGAELGQRLPDNLAGLATSLAAGLRSSAVQFVDRLLASEEGQEIWSAANRRLHETFLAVVHDETRPGVSTTDGVISLELREILVVLAERLGLPGTAIDQIPEGAGSVALLEPENLAQVQDAVALIEWASVALFVVIAVLFAAAVFLARGWRRVAIGRVGLAVLIDALLILIILRLARNHVLDNYVAVPANRAAVAEAWWIATELIRDIAATGVLAGALIIIATVLVGAARPAVSFQRLVGPKIVANPGLTWASVALALLVVAVWTPFGIVSTWFGFLTTAVIVIVTVVAMRLRSQQETSSV